MANVLALYAHPDYRYIHPKEQVRRSLLLVEDTVADLKSA